MWVGVINAMIAMQCNRLLWEWEQQRLPECTVGPSDHLVAIRYHARVPRMKLLSLVIIFLCYQSAKLARMSSVIMTNSIVRSTAGMSAASKVIYSYPELRTGILVTRYKRFLADIEFDTEMLSASPMTSLDSSSSSSSISSSASRDTALEKVITVVHCPNTGSMYKLIPPHNILPECACSTAADGAKRKYPNTLEMIKENGVWVGINSALANKMVENALNAK